MPHSPHRIWTRGNSHNHEETLVSRALCFPSWIDWQLFPSLAAFCFSGGYHCKPFPPNTSLLYFSTLYHLQLLCLSLSPALPCPGQQRCQRKANINKACCSQQSGGGRCKSEINSESDVYLCNLQTLAFPSSISIDNGVVCVMIKKLKIVSHKSEVRLVSGFPGLGQKNNHLPRPAALFPSTRLPSKPNL